MTPEKIFRNIDSAPERKLENKLVLVDVENLVETQARDIADLRMTEEANELQIKGFKEFFTRDGSKKFFKKLWKHDTMHHYYHRKEVEKAKKEMRETGNIFTGEEADVLYSEKAKESIVSRFADVEYEETIHTEAGEKRYVLGENETKEKTTEDSTDLKREIKQALKDFASGKIDENQFQEERNRVLSKIHGVAADHVDNHLRFTDNMLEMAKQYRDAVEHGLAIDNLDNDLNFDIVVGKARLGVRTEAKFDMVDRIMDKLQKGTAKSKVLSSLVNETGAALAVATATSVGLGLAKRSVSTIARALPLVGTALVGGSIGFARERKRLTEERRQHSREMAKGRKYDEKEAVRRVEMEQYRYQTIEASTAIDQLKATMYEIEDDGSIKTDENGHWLLKDLSKSRGGVDLHLQTAIDQLSDLEARVKISDRHNIDMIQYSDVTAVEHERQQMDLLRGQVKRDLKQLIENKGGLVLTDGTKIDDFNDFYKQVVDSRQELFMRNEVENKNRLFNKMRNSRALKAAGKGAMVGAVVGTAFQEGAAFFRGNQQGLVESGIDSIFNKKEDILGQTAIKSNSALESLREYLWNDGPEGSQGTQVVNIDNGLVAKIPAGCEMIKNEDGTYSLVGGEQTIVEKIEIEPDGSIAEEFKQELKENGVTISEMIRGHALNSIEIDDKIVRLPEHWDIKKEVDGTYSIFSKDNHDTILAGLNFAENNSLIVDEQLQAELQSKNIIFESTTAKYGSDLLAGVGVEENSSQDFINKHQELFEQIKRNLWYDNDTPKPIFDKNELKLHWGGKGGLDTEGNYVFNVIKMDKDGSYHTFVDGSKASVDAQELIKKGEMKVQLSVSVGTQNQVIELPIDPETGNVIIDKDSPIGEKLFALDDKGHAKYLGKYAEVVHTVGQTQEGLDQVRILATAVGEGLEDSEHPGATDQEVPIAIFDRDEKIPIFDLDPNREIEMPPIIPVYWRKSLENTKRKDPGIEVPPPYYMMSGEIDKNSQAEFEKKCSPTLKENPAAELDSYAEIKRYTESFSSEHKQQVDRLVGQIEPINEKCRVSVCIPVAGHQEEKNIYRTLENYTKQTVDDDEFEIVLFVNNPDKDQKGNPYSSDKTLAEIDRFKKDYPQIKLRSMHEVLVNKDQQNIGTIRKLLNDAVLVRQLARGKDVKDLIMVSNDADNLGIAPEYIRNFIKRFDSDKKVDAMLGQVDWDPEGYVKYPALHMGTRLFQYLNAIGRHKTGRMISSGANFAFKSSILAAIGGYRDKISGGEDIAIGQAIMSARKGDKERIKYAGAKNSRIYTSLRRAIDQWKNHALPPIKQWSRGFSAFDDEIRKIQSGDNKEIDFDSLEDLEKLKQQIEYVLNSTLDTYEAGEKIGKDAKFYKKAIGWMGIKYKLDDKGDIVVTSMDSLLNGLKEYQKYGVLLRDAKSGDKEAKNKLDKLINKNTAKNYKKD